MSFSVALTMCFVLQQESNLKRKKARRVNIAAKLNTPAVSSWTPSSHMAEQCRRRKLYTRDEAVVH